MKRFSLLLMIVLVGCSPTKRLARLLERYPIPETHDTVLIPGEVIYRDTIIYKYLPGESTVNNVYFHDTVNIPDTIIMAETTFARALAHLDDNHLGLELIQFDTVFKWKLDSAIRVNRDTIRITNDIPYPVITERGVKSYWRVVAITLFGIILIAMILLFAFRKR